MDFGWKENASGGWKAKGQIFDTRFNSEYQSCLVHSTLEDAVNDLCSYCTATAMDFSQVDIQDQTSNVHTTIAQELPIASQDLIAIQTPLIHIGFGNPEGLHI